MRSSAAKLARMDFQVEEKFDRVHAQTYLTIDIMSIETPHFLGEFPAGTFCWDAWAETRPHGSSGQDMWSLPGEEGNFLPYKWKSI